MIGAKIWETPLSWHAKCSLPVAVRVSKLRLLKLHINSLQNPSYPHLSLLTVIRSILLNDVERLLGCANGFNTSSAFDSTELHERPGIQSQAEAAVVSMDTDMDTSFRDRLVRTRIPNDVEKRETIST